MNNNASADVIIVGAGMSGLMAAHVLEDAGYSVLVLDKAKSVGGRMATRRIGHGVADHGAQFFTAREPVFQQYVDRWIDENIVYVWSMGFSDGSLVPEPQDGHPRYAVHGGMNKLPKHLAASLKNVQTDTYLVSVTGDEQGWIVQDDNGDLYTSQGLILTSPVPQSLDLMDAGATFLSEPDFIELAKITYAMCLCGLFWIEGRVTLPQPGAVQRRNSNIVWIADNQQKGISPEATLITVQAGEQYSRQMWNAPEYRILNALKTDLMLYVDQDVEFKEAQLKRWRYSRPLVTYHERCMVADYSPPLIFAGDAFGGPRVEGAVLSGLAAGQQMIAQLSK
ncbi:MAG: hypothetical protein CUN56_02665 [Phototrophicales bacterium]|nr:MAG: hypothetical protein CUN56_02665 [Phototrophicales bacterium]RMG75844.1 MAG: FAD-binding protein [Chloroflexota bacterium]